MVFRVSNTKKSNKGAFVIKLLYLCGFAILVYAPQPVFAQTAEELGYTYDENGEMNGLGPKGRITTEQGQFIALQRLRGEILDTDIFVENDRYFYAYKILVPDQSVYEVEIYAANGEIDEIEIEYLSPDAVLPMTLMDQTLIRNLAVNHVNEETLGARKPVIRSIRVGAYKRKPAYFIDIKKSAKRFDIIIDAITGKILEMSEQ